MTTTQSHPDGSPSEAEERWLSRLVKDDYGIVMTCAASISKTSIAFQNQLSFGDETFLPALSALAARLTRPGTLLLAQLCHGGSRAVPGLTGQPAHAPSRFALPIPGFVPPLELSTGQIETIIEDFAAAATRASRAGFGGVELHGANGYLFTQFTSTMTNRRVDDFGGNLMNRARFSRAVVRAIRAQVPKDFVLGYRMSFEGFGNETGLDIDENIELLNWLFEDGIDYGHISHLNAVALSQKYPDRVALSHIRARVDRRLPLIAAGGIQSRAAAELALELGADLVALGRAAIGNAKVPEKLAKSLPLSPTPYRPKDLAALSVSPDFMRYLTTAPPLASLKIVASDSVDRLESPISP